LEWVEEWAEDCGLDTRLHRSTTMLTAA
jgi:hypothetical protein